MKLEELTPKPIDKVQFKFAFFKSVPQINGCYVITTFDNSILYIGLATDLNSRFKEHLNNKEKTAPTKEGKAIWFYFSAYDSRNLPKLERTWLNQYKDQHGQLPILNKVNSPVS